MSYFVVIRERTPAWNEILQITGQEKFEEHSNFMNRLIEEGFLILGGPMEEGRRILMVVDAEDENQIRERISDDPWSIAGLLEIVSIWRWNIMIGSLEKKGI